MRRIMIDKELCNGCLSCTLACMAEHNATGATSMYELDLEDTRNESRHLITLDDKGNPIPIFCRHCDEPECAQACMSGAMVKEPDTGLVTYDSEQCAACFMCVMACPYSVLKADDREKKVIVKCDFCAEQDSPRCVEHCPNNAIYVIEVNTL